MKKLTSLAPALRAATAIACLIAALMLEPTDAFLSAKFLPDRVEDESAEFGVADGKNSSGKDAEENERDDTAERWARLRASLQTGQVPGSAIQPASVSRVNFDQLAEQDRQKTPIGPETGIAIPNPVPKELDAGTQGGGQQPPGPAGQTGQAGQPGPAPAVKNPQPAIPSPAPATNYLGQEDGPKVGTSTFTIPPDTQGAVGLDKVFSNTNQNYRVQDKATGAALSTVNSTTFWASSGGTGFFDPRIVFDPYNQRWILAMDSDSSAAGSSIEIAVSQTPDPQGSYFIYRFVVGCASGAPGCAAGGEWADFPMLGFNKNWIAVSMNMFNLAGTANNNDKVLVLDYAQARAGTAVGTLFSGAAIGFCNHPVQTFSASEPALYLAQHLSSAGATYKLSTITGTPAAPVFTLGTTKTRPGGGWTQPGGDILPQQCVGTVGVTCPATLRFIDVGDAQVRGNAVFRNGGIYYSQTIGLPAGTLTHTAVQWTKLDTAGNVADGGRINDATATNANGGKWYGYPTMTVNSANDFLIGFSQYASNQFAAAGYAYHDHTDAAGTTRDPYIYKDGEDYYAKTFSGTRNRWGDYSHTLVDPIDDLSLWTVQEYAQPRTTPNASSVTNNSRWGTWWAKLFLCPTITLSPLALADGLAGIPYSQTITASGGISGFTFSYTGTLPPGLTLSPNGLLSGTPTATGNFSFTVIATNEQNCMGSQSYNVNITCPTITLAPVSLVNGDVGTPYSQTITASPAGGNYAYAVANGSLPPGLTLNGTTGVVSGTPSQTGVFNFRVTASLVGGCSGFRDYLINITGCAPITVNPATLAGGTVGTAYNATVSATPAGAYTFTVTAGALPNGLSLNAASGLLSGTATQGGTFNFRITATLDGCSGFRDYTVAIACPTITLGAISGGTAGAAYNQTITVSPAGSYTFSLVAGNLPSGLSLNPATGAISGLPTVTGTYNFTVKADAGNGCAGTQSYSLVINCPPTISISPATLPDGTAGTAYSATISAAPAGGNYNFAVSSGAMPPGLSLNSGTGQVSGTPTASGSYSFTVTAIGFGTCTSAQKLYTINIGPSGCAVTLPASLPGGKVGQLYNQSVAASPSGSYTYTLSGTLPPGITFYNAAALLNGYPTAQGSFTFTITATQGACSATQTYTVVISPPGFARAVAGDFDGDGKSDLAVWRGMQSIWMIAQSSNSQMQSVLWGAEYSPYNDVIVPADYDGDGKVDVAVFRRGDGNWYIKRSSDGGVTVKYWGLATDTPVAGDYDGDGKADIAVWRGSEGRWYIVRSSDGQAQVVSWGASYAPYFDVPVPADYDGDGKTDVAVFRRGNGHWYIRRSSDGAVVDKYWGLGTDVPVAADYDGDGKADIAVWRGSDTNWYIILSGRSSDDAVQTVAWGAASLGDVPVPGDYDGDGQTDIAVWRPSSGTWFVRCSYDASLMTKVNGQSGDTPVTSVKR